MNRRWREAVCAGIILILSSDPTVGNMKESDSVARQKVHSMYNQYKKQAFSNVPELTVDQYHQMRNTDSLVMVDVREQEEQDVSMIPSAITKEQFESNKEEYKQSKIVVYCTIGYRSGEYAQSLVDKGFDAYNFIGGVLAWAHEELLFVHDASGTDSVHVYGEEWDLAPKEYKTVW